MTNGRALGMTELPRRGYFSLFALWVPVAASCGLGVATVGAASSGDLPSGILLFALSVLSVVCAAVAHGQRVSAGAGVVVVSSWRRSQEFSIDELLEISPSRFAPASTSAPLSLVLTHNRRVRLWSISSHIGGNAREDSDVFARELEDAARNP